MSTRKFLWGLVTGRWRLLALVLVPSLLLRLSPLAIGFLVRSILNAFQGHSAARFSTHFLLATLGALTTARICVMGLRAWAGVRWGFFLTAFLQREVLQGLLLRPGTATPPVGSAETLNRLRDDVDTVQTLPMFAIEAFGSLVFAIWAAWMLLRINVLVTFVVIAPMIGVALLAMRVQPAIGRRWTAARAATEASIGTLGAVLGAGEALRLNGRVLNAVEHFQRTGGPRQAAETRAVQLGEYLKSSFSGMVLVGLGALSVVAAMEAHAGRFSAGDFGFFAYLLPYVSEVTTQVGDLFARMRSAEVSLGRLEELAPMRDTARAQVPSPPTSAPLQRLHVEGLTSVYPNGAGIRDATFTLERGQIVAITGALGSGKTTLLKSLIGLLPRSSGRVTWNENEVVHPGAFFVPPVCGYVPQVSTLLSLSIRDNITLGRELTSVELQTCLHRAVLESDLTTLEGGLDSVVGIRGTKLSGGQMQRVAAARVFVRNPELFVLDDFGSALDVDTDRAIWARLMARPERTVLVATHRRATLAQADRILVLAEGRVVGQGTLKELLVTCPEMQRLWSSAEAATG